MYFNNISIEDWDNVKSLVDLESELTIEELLTPNLDCGLEIEEGEYMFVQKLPNADKAIVYRTEAIGDDGYNIEVFFNEAKAGKSVQEIDKAIEAKRRYLEYCKPRHDDHTAFPVVAQCILKENILLDDINEYGLFIGEHLIEWEELDWLEPEFYTYPAIMKVDVDRIIEVAKMIEAGVDKQTAIQCVSV